MKKLITLISLSVFSLCVCAQEEKKTTVIQLPQWVQDIKLSGYGMLQYQAHDKPGAHDNSFNLRLARLSLEGRILQDFYWKVQMQINGNTSSLGSSPRLVDLFGEWQRYSFFKVKAGQFKRPFSFENPMHPITQGFMSYSQNVTKLTGHSDRTGEHPSNGRDIGLQFQGDFLKNSSGRELLHYQVGVFNGEGINRKDADNRKDFIGGLWVMPVKGMRIGAFGWTGSSVINRENVVNGETVTRGVRTGKNRYAISGEYCFDDWTIRSEYIHSQGYGANLAAGDKADGFYALCIAPVVKNKCHVKARYDVYRDRKEWGSARTNYEIGADYVFSKNLQINLEYARVNDKTLPDKHSYNLVDVELDFRF